MRNLSEFINEALNTSSSIIEESLAKMQLSNRMTAKQPFQICIADIDGDCIGELWFGLDDLKHIKTKKQLFDELMELGKITQKKVKCKTDMISIHNGDSYDCPGLVLICLSEDKKDFCEFEPYFNPDKTEEFIQRGATEKDFEGPEKEALSEFLASLK